MTAWIRETPPLHLTWEAVTPGGRRYRWAADAPDPRDKPSGGRHSSTMPGGYESADVTLPRKASGGDADLERLTTLRAVGAGGAIASETRLERSPRVSGDQMAVSPSAVGWQAHLADDKSAALLGIDRDLGRFRGATSARRLSNATSGRQTLDPDVAADPTTGAPSVTSVLRDTWGSSGLPFAEALYDAGDFSRIGRLRATWTRNNNVAGSGGNWQWLAALMTDANVSGLDSSGNLQAAGPANVDLAATTSTRRYAYLTLNNGAAGGAAGVEYAIVWTNVRVVGDHGLPIYGSTPGTEGLLASDLVAYIVGRFAPLLNLSDGGGSTIEASSFTIPQFAHLDATNAGELVRQATRFGLQDWAVWDNQTFYWHERGQRGRNWRARSGPTQLEETGPQIDRLWESVIVQYRDVDGSTRTVGPPGSGAGTETGLLKDSDPENPANKLDIVRREMLQAGTLTPNGAIEIGRRFLEQQKLLDSSGRARIIGHVLDDYGVLHPYWRIKAGDTISFTDAADTSPRRIVKASHDDTSYSCSVDLDAPPDAMDALLERLGVVLVPLGVG